VEHWLGEAAVVLADQVAATVHRELPQMAAVAVQVDLMVAAVVQGISLEELARRVAVVQ
jgi:hypothetical protein